MARLLLLDVHDDVVKEVECNSLDDYYKYLRCDCFAIPSRKIDGKYFDIYCDDNGLYAEPAIVSAADSAHNPMLFGNLIFANHDDFGNTVDLSDDDIAWIKSNILVASQYTQHNTLIHKGKLLANCDY